MEWQRKNPQKNKRKCRNWWTRISLALGKLLEPSIFTPLAPKTLLQGLGYKNNWPNKKNAKRSFKYDSKSSCFCDSYEKQLSYFIVVTLKHIALYSSVSHLANIGCLCASAALERKLPRSSPLKKPKTGAFWP